ncbi:hypothetical protein HDU98_002577 [Podochytrium sp. JEL0797]|nr:hypothetical protein HDU98_002577 [Podochytrium sp. JEL0797]
MIAACLYIFSIAVRAALEPIQALQRKLQQREDTQAACRASSLEMDPTQYLNKIHELETQMNSGGKRNDAVAEEYRGSLKREEEFDAMLDEMIEDEKRKMGRSNRGIVSAAEAGGMRKRIVAGDQEIKNREMHQNLRKVYDFDSQDESGSDEDDSISEREFFSNDVRV